MGTDVHNGDPTSAHPHRLLLPCLPLPHASTPCRSPSHRCGTSERGGLGCGISPATWGIAISMWVPGGFGFLTLRRNRRSVSSSLHYSTNVSGQVASFVKTEGGPLSEVRCVVRCALHWFQPTLRWGESGRGRQQEAFHQRNVRHPLLNSWYKL